MKTLTTLTLITLLITRATAQTPTLTPEDTSVKEFNQCQRQCQEPPKLETNDSEVDKKRAKLLIIGTLAGVGIGAYALTRGKGEGSELVPQPTLPTVPSNPVTPVSVEEPTAPPIPEPGTMLLLGSGLIGLAAYLRRRKKGE